MEPEREGALLPERRQDDGRRGRNRRRTHPGAAPPCSSSAGAILFSTTLRSRRTVRRFIYIDEVGKATAPTVLSFIGQCRAIRDNPQSSSLCGAVPTTRKSATSTFSPSSSSPSWMAGTSRRKSKQGLPNNPLLGVERRRAGRDRSVAFSACSSESERPFFRKRSGAAGFCSSSPSECSPF